MGVLILSVPYYTGDPKRDPGTLSWDLITSNLSRTSLGPRNLDRLGIWDPETPWDEAPQSSSGRRFFFKATEVSLGLILGMLPHILAVLNRDSSTPPLESL